MSTSHSKPVSARTNAWLLAGILCVALNLRPALSSVGPLVEDIRVATGLSNSLLGLLTTLPLLAFGFVSVVTPLFTKRFGMGGTLFGAMILLIIGIVLRSLGWIPALYFGTLLLGIAIAFGNVLLPGLTKRNFSNKAGFVTSLYSSVMALGAALAAGLSVPIAKQVGLGWRWSLATWAVLAFIAAIVWVPQLARLKKVVPKMGFVQAMKNVTRSRLAWLVALFMGLQSWTFYVILAWLPTILQSRGYDAAFSGWMLSLSQAMGIFGSLLIPVLAGRTRDQRGLVVFLAVIELVGLIGLLFPSFGHVAIWVSFLGFMLGGTFGLALMFIVLRTNDAEGATELSGMAQSVGYFIAATGPFLFGFIYDIGGSWTYPMFLLLLVGICKMGIGLGAGKPSKMP